MLSDTVAIGPVQVNTDGFGDADNENFKDMVIFNVSDTNWLCGGTLNNAVGAQVWCTIGGDVPITWVQKNQNGFGDVKYGKVWSTSLMDGYLYVGTHCYSGGSYCLGAVWRTDGSTADGSRWTWTKVFETDTNQRVDIVGVFDGYLYIGFYGSSGTEIWRSSSGGAGNWYQVNEDGFGNADNGRVIVDAGIVYNNALYIATLNTTSGAEVWRTADGTTWELANTDGFDDVDTIAAELVVFNGNLYAWATNYNTGQQVLRSKCPLCQTRAVDGTGSYSHTFKPLVNEAGLYQVSAVHPELNTREVQAEFVIRRISAGPIDIRINIPRLSTGPITVALSFFPCSGVGVFKRRI